MYCVWLPAKLVGGAGTLWEKRLGKAGCGRPLNEALACH